MAQQGKGGRQKSEGVSRKRRETRKWGLTKKERQKEMAGQRKIFYKGQRMVQQTEIRARGLWKRVRKNMPNLKGPNREMECSRI